jgi:hypothetical protein
MFVILIWLKPTLLTKCDGSTDSHAFKNVLTKTQCKKLKQAHQDELVVKLQELSIA